MDEQKIRSMEPFSGWSIGAVIGQGRYGKVFVVAKELAANKKRYCAMKWIPFPGSPGEMTDIANRLGGVGEQTLQEHFRLLCNEFCNEIVMMDAVKKCDNIVKYEDHQVVKRRGEIGYDVFIRMELLKPLTERMRKPMTVGDVVRMGIDLCRGLKACEENKIIHRDIKPDNIFVDENDTYKLGDFGVARQRDESFTGMSRKGTPSYMAPEVYRGLDYDFRVDMYSLGLVMHRLLNKNRLPFLPAGNGAVTAKEREDALTERLRGAKPIPPPAEGFDALNRVIAKAINYDPAKRYPSAEQFMKALLTVQKKGKNNLTRVLHLPVVEGTPSYSSSHYESPLMRNVSEIQTSRRVDFHQEPVQVQHVSGEKIKTQNVAPMPVTFVKQDNPAVVAAGVQPTPAMAPPPNTRVNQPVQPAAPQAPPVEVPRMVTRQNFQPPVQPANNPPEQPAVRTQQNAPNGNPQIQTPQPVTSGNNTKKKSGKNTGKEKNVQTKTTSGNTAPALVLLLISFAIVLFVIVAIANS